MKTTILIMAKQPVPGASKTRLIPTLSARDAAELSSCFIADTARSVLTMADGPPSGDGTVGPVAGFDLRVVIAGTPAGAEGVFKRLVPEVGFVAQIGDSLGQRLNNVLSGALADGASMAIAINSDSPTMPNTLVAQAIGRLSADDIDVVLGPADDGGYYLIGWKRPHPRLVEGVVMSTPTVLRDTLEIARSQQLRVALTDPWYDVDQPEDLRRLRAELDEGRPCGPQTAAFFASRPTLGLSSAPSGSG